MTAGAAQRIKELEKYKATAVFTSVHGVDAVAECLLFSPSWKYACISGATKNAVERYFDEKDIIASAKNATLLAEELVKEPYEPVLFFCGNRRLDIIPDKLKQGGIEFEEIQVYKTDLTPQKLDMANTDAVLFLSTTAVESFFMLNTMPDKTACFAIGETTAAAIKQKVGNKVMVADQPGKKEIVDLVIKYYHEHS